MLTRRGFLGALAALVAAGRAAPAMLARLHRPARPELVVTVYRDQHGRPWYASIHPRHLVVNVIASQGAAVNSINPFGATAGARSRANSAGAPFPAATIAGFSGSSYPQWNAGPLCGGCLPAPPRLH